MGTESSRTFGELLRMHRMAVHLSQEELAERAKMSVRGVSDLERGIHQAPYRVTVAQLATALGLDEEERDRLEAATRRQRKTAVPSGRARVSRPHNLAEESTSFIGRAGEIAEIQALLRRPEGRLITLTGPGGSGKTRLALRAAATVLDQFPDGVFLVSLAPVTDAKLVGSAVVEALGLAVGDRSDVVLCLKEHLRDRAVLLVLDNFEHLLDASWLLPELLEGCPGVRMLVTSRAVLRLSWERVFPVAPLAVPGPPHTGEHQVLSHYEGVALFVDRAMAASSDFRVTSANAPAVAEICYRLDGLPLAIELAAARIRMLPPQALLGRLSSRLKLLVGGARDQPSRQQTLRAAIDWSYSLLDKPEQRLFMRLAVFNGGCTLDAAAAVCGFEDDSMEVLAAVGSLVDKSLVSRGSDTTSGESRFRMLETIREYAMECLESSSDSEAIRRRHATYFVELSGRTSADLAAGVRDEWLDRLDDEHDNVRTALQWAYDNNETELGLRLAVRLEQFWEARGQLAEGRRWLANLLSNAEGSPPALHAAALRIAGSRTFAPDLAQAAVLTELSLGLYREAQDLNGTAEALYQRGVIAFYQADYARARECLEESQVLARGLGDTNLLSQSLWTLASLDPADDGRREAKLRRAGGDSLAMRRKPLRPEDAGAALDVLLYNARAEGDLAGMHSVFDQIMANLRDPGLRPDPVLRKRLQRIAYEMATIGDYPRGTALLDEGVLLNLRNSNRRDATYLKTSQAQFLREQGHYQQAADLAAECLELFREFDDLQGVAITLISLSDVARDRGDQARARDIAEQGLAVARDVGNVLLGGYAQHNHGFAAWQLGDQPGAELLFRSALDALSPIAEGRAEVLASIGLMELDRGRLDLAVQSCEASLAVIRLGDLPWLVATNLEVMAGVQATEGHADLATRLYGAAEAVRRTSGTPVQQSLRPMHERLLALARQALGDERFTELFEQGAGMSMATAIATALTGVDHPRPPDGPERLWRGFRD